MALPRLLHFCFVMTKDYLPQEQYSLLARPDCLFSTFPPLGRAIVGRVALRANAGK